MVQSSQSLRHLRGAIPRCAHAAGHQHNPPPCQLRSAERPREEPNVLSPTRARATLLAACAAVAGLLMGSLAAAPSAAADQESCRPDGLYGTRGAAAPC
ncbi:hypothetical protein GA0115254_106610 [Streptomyces sp. Ncost-T10-10d]|nr:hypothetical protein GA0115254_106610 [Streptomyces sp. Ncost-T10-10d]